MPCVFSMAFFFFFFSFGVVCEAKRSITKQHAMQRPEIRYYNPTKAIQPNDLFILCKGLNSGKPLAKPCPNCFVIHCSYLEEYQFYYALCFGLWKARYYNIYLTGSVIEFLRIADFKMIIRKKSGMLQPAEFFKTVEKVMLIEKQELAIREQLKLMAEIKICLLRRHL